MHFPWWKVCVWSNCTCTSKDNKNIKNEGQISTGMARGGGPIGRSDTFQVPFFELFVHSRSRFSNFSSTLGLGEGELTNVGYTGMCHRPGSIFHIQNRPQIFNFFRNRLYFLKFYSRTGPFFDNLVSNVKNPSCFPQNDGSNPNFLVKNYAYLSVEDTGCVPVMIIFSKVYSNKLMLPVEALVSCSLTFLFSFCYT